MISNLNVYKYIYRYHIVYYMRWCAFKYVYIIFVWARRQARRSHVANTHRNTQIFSISLTHVLGAFIRGDVFPGGTPIINYFMTSPRVLTRDVVLPIGFLTVKCLVW